MSESHAHEIRSERNGLPRASRRRYDLVGTVLESVLVAAMGDRTYLLGRCTGCVGGVEE